MYLYVIYLRSCGGALMAVRTLLKLGKSSLVVVLPKDWLREVGLRSGDKVLVKQEEDGSLKIIPANMSLSDETLRARVVVNLDKCGDEKLVQRLLVANYLIGNDTVTIISKKSVIPPHTLKSVREVISKLRGFEIIEQRPDLIVLQCMTDATKFSMENLVGRLLALILSMVDYVKKAFDEGKMEYLKEIPFLEDELDRIYWFGVRQLLMVQRNRALAKFVGIESALHIVGNRTILKVLELAGDYLEEIAKDLLRAQWEQLEKCEAFRKAISNLVDQIEDIIGDTLRAFNGLDIFLANEILERVAQLEKQIHENAEKILLGLSDVKTGGIIMKVFTRLVDMAKSLGVVCEVVINRSMEEPGRMARGCIYREV